MPHRRRSLLLHGHRHRDRIERVVPLVSRDTDNLIDNLDPTKDFSKHRIPPIQTAVLSHANKKLRAVVVEVARAVALTGHFRRGDRAALMGLIVRLGRKKVSRSARAVESAIGSFAQWIAPLNEEAGHHTMERGAVIELHLDEIDEVLHMARRRIGVEPNLDLTESRRDRDPGIFLSKLECHRHECSKAVFMVTSLTNSAES